NDVSPESGTLGGTDNTIHLISADGVEDWPRMSKEDVADRLADRVAATLGSAA
ncbi:MAG: bifunctional phosphopantothenoylcysteine decarboxylase/phosphopantothenate synthase, partial [Alphaproteobacteria bacterium]|nr:bifunctional phosphopantothenoylcysteine decarboxylase/phosphopantothenate synthase [Alphaproteobacteria bacterium]